jgi:hypothetical protein
MSYVAVFRSYDWDETVDELAIRFFRACPGGRHIVLADDSCGIVPVPPRYWKLPHDDRLCARLGLPAHPPDRPLWYNVDYGFYFVREELPEFDHYVTCESDLAVNLSLEPMMDFVARERIDLLTHRVKPSTENWYWHRNAEAVFASPWQSLLCMTILSHRAVETLLVARQELARRFIRRELKQWPFCESFVPSVLMMLSGARIARLEDFASTENLRFRPCISPNDSRANVPGSLVHSVRHPRKTHSATVLES